MTICIVAYGVEAAVSQYAICIMLHSMEHLLLRNRFNGAIGTVHDNKCIGHLFVQHTHTTNTLRLASAYVQATAQAQCLRSVHENICVSVMNGMFEPFDHLYNNEYFLFGTGFFFLLLIPHSY